MPSANALRQPTRQDALSPYWADRTEILGVIGLRCRVTLHLETQGRQTKVSLPFAVDSGASYTLISLELAQRRRILVPPKEAEIEIPMRSATGNSLLKVRPGRVRAWWDDRCRGYPFDWPVLFRVDAPLDVPCILGLGGIVKTCRWTFDGSYSLDAPYGTLTLEDIR